MLFESDTYHPFHTTGGRLFSPCLEVDMDHAICMVAQGNQPIHLGQKQLPAPGS